MEPEFLRLSELACARVCHDLGGLAGTLSGTLELAQEEGGEALMLAREAADALARRLKLLRAALGPASDSLGASAIAELARGLDERVRVDASGLGAKVLAPEQARLALAMLMLGAETLPAGGALRLSADAQGALSVSAAGPRAAWPSGTAQGLAGKHPAGSRDLLAPLGALLARAAGMDLAAMGAPAGDAPPSLRATPAARLPG